ncbi:hypothetical protein BDP27DRAFT_1315002 [Rhodocollybia butyracea]|uniref:TPR-like protein n=1 Tax=Rhodocollybia butyracea TaxID=206335 RepID=A0A9P5Q4R9_9AGAR|nr:hypothetical protein BDP27DRAFT_1315002 [Rhodocollybia butyracea]
MALPMLVGGAECGPSNPLQGLSKRFDNDRGLQQDYFGAGRAGSSQEAFRSQSSGRLQVDEGATQFFAKSPPPQFSGNNAYDLGALSRTLPALEIQQFKQNPVADWAADFLTHQSFVSSPIQNSSTPPIAAANVAYPSQVMPWSSGMSAMGMRSVGAFTPMNMMSTPNVAIQSPQISWDKEFDAQHIAAGPSHSETKEIVQPSHEQDELARTAGLLLETVKAEQNPKFQNSQFMSLMAKLRDHKVIVSGNEMVDNDGTFVATRTDVKGKGRASDIPFVPSVDVNRFVPLNATGSLTAQERVLLGEHGLAQEDANDAYFRQENEEYIRHWNTTQKPSTSIESSWDHLQEDWDKFEASTQGIKPIISYQFQKNNPYLRGEGSLRTRHHSMHLDERLETVLELEANVQRNMADASAWFELGVKQQEHERETQALQALTRATELDPSYLPGWLALAVSYTNDGRRLEAHDAIREWVIRNKDHHDIVQQHLARFPVLPDNATMHEKFSNLVQCLITMAQQSAVGQIDADIQIALAVLFNSNEDYEKAQDCFRAALSVRPDDWQLYNRVGATMANSGRAAEALEYYYRALDLNPVYIRARYNLGISCINLKRYSEGAQNILDALSLQDAEGVHDAEGLNVARGGITSNALWDSLKTACLHMQRVDLATLCDRRDLETFRFNFQLQ